jgi:DNA-binding transcriptional ArsR family regulator
MTARPPAETIILVVAAPNPEAPPLTRATFPLMSIRMTIASASTLVESLPTPPLDRCVTGQYNTIWLCNQLVMQTATRHLDLTFAALADPTRRAILARLASGQATVNQLAEPFAMTQPAISKHLKVLERAGLVSRDRDAQRRPSRLEPKRLAEANAWLEQYREFWEASFARLDDLLEELKPKKTKRGTPSRRG